MPCPLPLEVIELVLDALADIENHRDASTLAACTLLNKTLFPYTSKLLFRRPITLDIPRLRAFEAAVKTSSRLAAYTAWLVVEISEYDPPTDVALKVSALHGLRRVVGALPALASLHVLSDGAVDDAVQHWDAAPVAAHPLKDLCVIGAQVPLTNAILGFFPAVDTLTVHEWLNERFPGAQATAHAVRRLVFIDTLECADVDSVLDVARVVSPPCLASLVVGLYDPLEQALKSAAINDLLGALGQHISRFEILQCNGIWDAGVDSALPALSQCMALASVVLHVRAERSPVGAPPAPTRNWSKAIDALASLPPHVTHVTLALHAQRLHFHDLIDGLDWPRVESALRKCVALQRVEAVIYVEKAAAEQVAQNTETERWHADVCEGIMKQMGPRLLSLFALRIE